MKRQQDLIDVNRINISSHCQPAVEEEPQHSSRPGTEPCSNVKERLTLQKALGVLLAAQARRAPPPSAADERHSHS